MPGHVESAEMQLTDLIVCREIVLGIHKLLNQFIRNWLSCLVMLCKLA